MINDKDSKKHAQDFCALAYNKTNDNELEEFS